MEVEAEPVVVGVVVVAPLVPVVVDDEVVPRALDVPPVEPYAAAAETITATTQATAATAANSF